MIKKSNLQVARIVVAMAAMAAAAMVGAPVFAQPATPETSKYLVIGTDQGTAGDNFSAFRQSNTELGADQEVVSSNRDSNVPTPPQAPTR